MQFLVEYMQDFAKQRGEGGFMSDSGLFKNISDFYDTYIDNKFIRFLLLIGAGGLGLLFGKLVDVQFFRDCLGLHETVAEYLITAVVGIFVFILLWYFRTRDVRQQIEKTQAQVDETQRQICQNQFNDAIEHLTTSNNRLKEAVGLEALLKLSAVTSEFNKLITIAFENKIKILEPTLASFEKDKFERPLNKKDRRISSISDTNYINYKKLSEDMEDWLSDHKKPKEE